MRASDLWFLVLAGGLIAAVLGIGAFYFWRLSRSAKMEWETLLSHLVVIDHDAVDKVALDAIHPCGTVRTDKQARELDPDEIWRLLGRLEGVLKLEKNSRILIEMASYLQRSYPEASEIAEELRLHARELEYQVQHLRMASEQGSLEFHISTYAPNAAIAYYRMEKLLLELCERAKVSPFRRMEQPL